MSEGLYVAAFDMHYPSLDRPTYKAMLHFLSVNKVNGFVLGGDQFDNQEISHHTQGKPGLRKSEYFRNQALFDKEILKPIEAVLPKTAQRIWITGNHDYWEQELTQVAPEFAGIDRPTQLKLAERGWKVIECGKSYKRGKLNYIHGELLTTQYHAKKALELFVGNILYGHFHSPQSATKVLPYNITEKWQAHCAPILGKTNPDYLRNKPSAWLNGFVIIEYHSEGCFNLYPIVLAKGKFSYGGKVYGGARVN